MEEDPIIYGDRSKKFVDTIKNVLKNADIKQKYIDSIITDGTMKLFDMVFTHQSADPENNYEFLEMLGDSSLNKFIVWYYADRFPQLNCAKGVKVIARLKITYGSKIMVSRLATRMGFDMSFVTTRESHLSEVTKTLEDVTEAFIGAIELIFDKNYPRGVGYNIVFDMIKHYMDSEDISLKYEDLVDAKTRLFELAKYIQNEYSMKTEPKITFPDTGRARKHNDKDQLRDEEGYISGRVFLKTDNESFNRKYALDKYIGRGRAKTEKEVEQMAATQALSYFKKKGIFKPIPVTYRDMCTDFPLNIDLNIKLE